MKKIFSRLALAMMMAIVCTGFTSCGDDKDEPEAPATWGSSYIVTFELNDDVINTADITAHIANPDGTFREEKVTKSKLSWTLTGNKLPDKAGVLLTFVPKKNIDENKVYNIGINGGITVTSYRNEGVVDFKSDSENSHMRISKLIHAFFPQKQLRSGKLIEHASHLYPLQYCIRRLLHVPRGTFCTVRIHRRYISYCHKARKAF